MSAPTDPRLPAVNPNMANRYMKGRLPEGVDFAAYPGRSSTPLPTAESKSAERINQLKIWNEAATNDDKRRLNAAKAKGAIATGTAATRRTDSYKDAKDRHSASFHGAPPPTAAGKTLPQRQAIRTGGIPVARNKDMFADRSDSESEEEPDEPAIIPPETHIQTVPRAAPAHMAAATPSNPPSSAYNSAATADPPSAATDVAPPPAVPPASSPSLNPVVEPTHQIPSPDAHVLQQAEPAQAPPSPRKESKACCTLM